MAQGNNAKRQGSQSHELLVLRALATLNETMACSGGGGGGGGAFTYTNATSMPEEHGGYPAGTTFAAVDLQTLFDNIFYPFQVPAFTAFIMTAQSTTLEVGDSVVGGPRTFTWADTNSGNVAPNTVAVNDVTGASVLGSGLADDSTEVLGIGPSITKVTNSSHTWQVSATDTQATVFTRNFTVNWAWGIYHGENVATPIIEAQIEALNKTVTNTIAKTYNFVGGGYKYICFPSSLGALTTFKDAATLLSVPFEAFYLVSVTNAFGVTADYKVYRTTNILGSAINIIAS